MEAARVAKARGHQVTLIEESNEPGGQLLIASVPRYKEPIADLVKYLTRQLTLPVFTVPISLYTRCYQGSSLSHQVR